MKLKTSNQRSAPVNIYESLDETHRSIVLHLERLKTLVSLLQSDQAKQTSQDQMRNIIEFFAGPSREHHYDEERFVFPPLLAGSDAAVHRVVERLREEHAWIELQWLDIEAQLGACLREGAQADAQALIVAVNEFSLLMHDHMALEDSTLQIRLRERESTDRK